MSGERFETMYLVRKCPRVCTICWRTLNDSVEANMLCIPHAGRMNVFSSLRRVMEKVLRGQV